MTDKNSTKRLQPADIGKAVDGADWLEDENGKRLPLAARHIVIILISRADKSQPPYLGFPTENYLAKKLNTSPRQVRQHKRTLKRLGVINWFQPDRNSACRYVINWELLIKLGGHDGGIIQADAKRRKKASDARLRQALYEGLVSFGHEGTYLDTDDLY